MSNRISYIKIRVILSGLLILCCCTHSYSRDTEVIEFDKIYKVIEGVTYLFSHLGKKTIPEWDNAEIAKIHIMYDLEGVPTAYFVELKKEDKKLGYMIVGARKNYIPLYKCCGSSIYLERRIERIKEILLKNHPGLCIVKQRLIYFGGLYPYLESEIKKGPEIYKVYFEIMRFKQVPKKEVKIMQNNYEKCGKENIKKSQEIKNSWDYWINLISTKEGNDER